MAQVPNIHYCYATQVCLVIILDSQLRYGCPFSTELKIDFVELEQIQ